MIRLLAGLLLATLTLTGCAVDQSETLLGWASEVGLPQVIEDTSSAIGKVAGDLKSVGSDSDGIRTMVNVLRASGPALATQAEALASERASNNAAYETLRSSVVDAMRSYAQAAAALDADAVIASGDLRAVTEVVKALTSVSTELTALNAFIEAHGTDPTGAA